MPNPTCEVTEYIGGPHPGCDEFIAPTLYACTDPAVAEVRDDTAQFYFGEDGVTLVCRHHASLELGEGMSVHWLAPTPSSVPDTMPYLYMAYRYRPQFWIVQVRRYASHAPMSPEVMLELPQWAGTFEYTGLTLPDVNTYI